ncbi:MAG TPA: hypothetical protein VNV85_13975 [Puia sp.]|jgi:hypothetical protein|nr:hypothetical protein [Puia sp.]
MREYMLLIMNEGHSKAVFSDEQHRKFLISCKEYIAKLTEERKLISAQPILREGMIISGSKGAWKETAFDDSKEVQVGYYHIVAKDINEAIAIAKENPEFEYTRTARIEVRPLKMQEETIGYTYPKNVKVVHGL